MPADALELIDITIGKHWPTTSVSLGYTCTCGWEGPGLDDWIQHQAVTIYDALLDAGALR